ncbi:hypothetical protein BDW59DRAFT_165623 [Aspergillus cavernicola]|uniref:Transcription factor domain-containing protein n=1 Tax=Aspergillus cavernicola TaxID=176166 RepID=A0ABR4HS23_9EURO
MEWLAHLAVYLLDAKEALGAFRSAQGQEPTITSLQSPWDSHSYAPGYTSLVQFACAAQRLSQRDFNQMMPAPWALDSEFASVSNEMTLQEMRLLQYLALEESQPTNGTPSSPILDEDVTLPLIWHYSNLVLHRVFRRRRTRPA